MIDVTLNWEDKSETYSVPTGWDDVSVETFCKLFRQADELHPRLKLVKNIEILTGIPEESLMELTMDTFNEIVANFAFINTDVTGELREYVELEGEKYYLKSEFKDYTYGEQTSIEIILEQNDGNIMQCMDKMLCVMLRKKVDGKLERFNSDFMDRYELFKSIPISHIYKLITFFLSSNEE